MYQPRIADSAQLKKPNIYVQKLQDGLGGLVFDQDQVKTYKGTWRQLFSGEKKIPNDGQDLSSIPENCPLDIELGTGNGVHLAARALAQPERFFLGFEVKYKPLIQSAERLKRQHSTNARMVRFHAHLLDQLFDDHEINHVYIHFSDPWVSPRRPERRILGPSLWKSLCRVQKVGSLVEFKTDSRELFDWVLEQPIPSLYQESVRSFDLHGDESRLSEAGSLSGFPVRTGFESIFIRQGLPIHYVRWVKTTQFGVSDENLPQA